MKPLDLQFSARLLVLNREQKKNLRRLLLRLLRASRNGHPARTFYIVNPTGGLDPL